MGGLHVVTQEIARIRSEGVEPSPHMVAESLLDREVSKGYIDVNDETEKELAFTQYERDAERQLRNTGRQHPDRGGPHTRRI